MGIQACNSYNKIELEEFLRKTVGNQTGCHVAHPRTRLQVEIPAVCRYAGSTAVFTNNGHIISIFTGPMD
jgi:hypothetical protein